MLSSIRELHLRRDLLIMLAWREVKVKYKQSVMGFLWAILMPSLIVTAGILIRFVVARISGTKLTATDIALVSVKSVPWAFFVASVRFSSTSLISNANLIGKIYLPREVFPVAAVASQLLDLAVAAVVLTVILAVVHVGASLQLLWLPVLLGLLVTLAIGVGLFVSSAALFYRDVKYLVEVFVTFAIFFTPVFFEVAMLGELGRYAMLNPVAPLLEGIADVIVYHRAPPLAWVTYSAAISILILTLSTASFKRLEPYFAQSV